MKSFEDFIAEVKTVDCHKCFTCKNYEKDYLKEPCKSCSLNYGNAGQEDKWEEK